MMKETPIAMKLFKNWNEKVTSFRLKEGSIKSTTASITKQLNLLTQGTTAGVTYMLSLMMDESKVLKEKCPVGAGLFETYAKMGFAIPGYVINPRIAQPRSFFQLSSSIKESFYEVNRV